MSQSGKKQTKKGSAEPTVSPRLQTGDRPSRRTAIILASVVIILILAIVGVIGYPTYIAPFHRTVITVDNINIRMDYFLKRIKLSGSDPIAMLTQLTNDQIVKLGAPQYGIAVSPDDVDQLLKSMFRGHSENVSESGDISLAEFNEWYRQTLNESGLTDAEYKEIITTELLKSHLQEYLAARMPTVAEQAHIYVMTLETQKQAEKARARWEAGEKFTDLAVELSLDRSTGENGGEVGWFPKGGILTPQLEYEAFELSTGNVSQPIPIINEEEQSEGGTAPTIIGYHLIMVSEKASRELDATALQVLRSKVLDDWLSSQRQNYNIKWRGLTGDSFDSETYAWINWQVSKSKSSSSSSSQ